MNSRKLLMSPVLVTLVVLLLASFPSSALSATTQDGTTAQSPDKASDGKAPSTDPAKPPASDIKSAPTDEGQLATVNNAKIPSHSKIYVAPIVGGFENYIIAGLRNKKVPLTVA